MSAISLKILLLRMSLRRARYRAERRRMLRRCRTRGIHRYVMNLRPFTGGTITLAEIAQGPWECMWCGQDFHPKG